MCGGQTYRQHTNKDSLHSYTHRCSGFLVQIQAGDDAEGALGVVIKLPGPVDGGFGPVTDVAVVALERRGEIGGQTEGEGQVVLPRRHAVAVIAAGVWGNGGGGPMMTHSVKSKSKTKTV